MTISIFYGAENRLTFVTLFRLTNSKVLLFSFDCVINNNVKIYIAENEWRQKCQ